MQNNNLNDPNLKVRSSWFASNAQFEQQEQVYLLQSRGNLLTNTCDKALKTSRKSAGKDVKGIKEMNTKNNEKRIHLYCSYWDGRIKISLDLKDLALAETAL